MLFAKLLFFLNQIHFVVANEGIDFCRLHSDSDESFFDCREVTNIFALAVCILQRNTLYNVLGCTNYDANQALSWYVESGSQADDLDIVAPYYDNQHDKIVYYHNNYDGRLAVTPRGLLLVASVLEECRHCELEAAIAACPNSDFGEFINCLCCKCVRPDQISCLEKCIFRSSVGIYAVQKSFDQYQWFCTASCDPGDGSPWSCYTDDYRVALSCNSDVYRVKNGVRVCDDGESFSTTITLRSTTPVWSKLSQATQPTITPSTPTAGRRTDDGAARVEPYQTNIAAGTGSSYIGSEGHAIVIPLRNSIFLALLIGGKLLM